jgi:nucleotide-binding universal stress UspA family protein
MTNQTTLQHTIVVGVDGSDSSKTALAWAAEQARLTGTPVVAIATWDWPTSYGGMISWPESVDFEKDAREMLNRTVDQVLGAERRDEVIQRIIHGHAAPVLEDASHGAALLVVGCRGHGEFAGILLGSVSEFLTTHAHCPIVIVRGDEQSG